MADPKPTSHSTRSRRTARNVRRERLLAVVAVVVLFVAGGAALSLIAPGAPATVAATGGAWKAIETTGTPQPATPTPAFATLRGVELHLPVPARAVTVLAFHQSSYSDTVPVTSLVDLKDPAAAKKAATVARAARKAGEDATIGATPAGEEQDADGTWTGSALQLWRNRRNVKQKTAIDCGAAPGTPVFSPVDGIVMQIRPYKLYGRVNDFEIHVKPDAWNDLDVIILHVTNPSVTPGTRVVAGLTKVAQVRCLSKAVSGLQLRSYTLDGGNHTHFQINRIPKPNETWVLGQDPPGLVRHD